MLIALVSTKPSFGDAVLAGADLLLAYTGVSFSSVSEGLAAVQALVGPSSLPCRGPAATRVRPVARPSILYAISPDAHCTGQYRDRARDDVTRVGVDRDRSSAV